MQVQSINNNPNFGAITSIKTKGKDFKKASELADGILKKVVNNKECQFYDKSTRVVIEAIDFENIFTIMKYMGFMPYSNAVKISIYKNLDGNIFSKAWKNIKGFFAGYFTKDGENSKAYKEVAPYQICGVGDSFQRAYDDAIHLLSIGARPSQKFRRSSYN